MTAPAPIGLGGEPLPPVEFWPIVELDGALGETTRWRVAPVYVAPFSREDALAFVEQASLDFGVPLELPTPELVDAIWAAADLRLNPHHLMRDWNSPKDMRAYDQQARAIEREIVRALGLAGRAEFTLLAGSHKDWTIFEGEDGPEVDIYGWHDLRGNPVQKDRTGHDKKYCDYSQGARLVGRVG